MKKILFASLVLAALASCQSPAVGQYTLHSVAPAASPSDTSGKKQVFALQSIHLQDHFIRYTREAGKEEVLFFSRVRVIDPGQPKNPVFVYDRILAQDGDHWKEVLKGDELLAGAALGEKSGGNLHGLELLPAGKLAGKKLEISLRMIELDSEDKEKMNTLIELASAVAGKAGPEAALAAPVVRDMLKVLVQANQDDAEFSYDLGLSFDQDGKVLGGEMPQGASLALIKAESPERFDWPQIYEVHKYVWGGVYQVINFPGWLNGLYWDGFQSPFHADRSAVEPIPAHAHFNWEQGRLSARIGGDSQTPYADKSYMVLGLVNSEVKKEVYDAFNWPNVSDKRAQVAELLGKMLADPQADEAKVKAAVAQALNTLDEQFALYLDLKASEEEVDKAKKAVDGETDKTKKAELEKLLRQAQESYELKLRHLLEKAKLPPAVAEVEAAHVALKDAAKSALATWRIVSDKEKKAVAQAALDAATKALTETLAKLEAAKKALAEAPEADKDAKQKELETAQAAADKAAKDKNTADYLAAYESAQLAYAATCEAAVKISTAFEPAVESISPLRATLTLCQAWDQARLKGDPAAATTSLTAHLASKTDKK